MDHHQLSACQRLGGGGVMGMTELGGPVVRHFPATLFTRLLSSGANVALTIHVGVQVLVGLGLLELIPHGRGFQLDHVNLGMRHEFPVLPVRIQETTSVVARVVHRTAQAILARRTQHVITLHAEWFIHCRHLASCGGGLEEHGGEILLLRRPPRFK